jgi:hypothetical protein
MGCKKSIIVVGGFIIAVASLLAVSPAIHASDAYKIAMKRSHPDKPLTRDEILSAVEKRYKGRIMSLQAKPSSGAQDCHVVRMMSLTGEYMTIHVACD